MMSKRILITGGAGFIGANLANVLIRAGHDVTLLDSMDPYYDTKLKWDRVNSLMRGSKTRYFNLSLNEYDKMAHRIDIKSIDTVIHLAARPGVAPSMVDPGATYNSNVVGTANLLKLCVEGGIKKIIYASSSSVYGHTDRPSNEHDHVNPLSHYAVSKVTNETQMAIHAKQFADQGIEVIGLRLFSVYGPWGRPDMAYYHFTQKLLKGQPINLYDSRLRRDFTYVDDVSRAIVGLLGVHLPGHRVLNVGTGEPVAMTKVVSSLASLLGVEANLTVSNRIPASESVQTYCDNTALNAILGTQSFTSFDAGIKQFVDWYKGYHEN